MGFSNGNPIPNSGSDPASERIPELFSELRSSFFGIELEKVAKKFIEREEETNEHLIELENNVEQLLKDKNLLLLENKELKDDIKKKQMKINALTAANLAHKNEAKLLGSQKVRVLEKENDNLKEKIRVDRKTFMDLDKRVLMLEDNAKEFGGAGFVRYSSSLDLVAKQHKDCDTPVAAGSESGKLLSSNEKEGSNKRTVPKVQEVIHIDDANKDEDDDDQYISTLKRKGVSSKQGYNSDENNLDGISMFKSRSRHFSKETERETVISAERHRKNLDDLQDQHLTSDPLCTPNSSEIKPKSPMPSFDTPNSRAGHDIKKIDEAYNSIISKLKKENVRWQSEADMLEEFNKDDDLCLNGICALHRQKFRANAFDVLRMSTLARMLIDGDPQQRLKKKASELNQFDLNQCRRFAKEDYSSAIFNIYQRKLDPFFPSSSSKESMSDD